MNWKNVHLALKAFFGALLYYIVYVCAPALLMVFGMTIRKYGQSTEEFVRESGNFYTVLGFGLVVLFFYRRCKKKGTRLFDVIGLYPKQVTLKKGLGMYAFGFCVSVAVSALITLIPFPAWLIGDYTEQSLGIFSGKDIILGVVATGFLAPFMEEIMFRGFIFSKLLEGFTERTSILLVSLMFALLHVNPVWILYALQQNNYYSSWKPYRLNNSQLYLHNADGTYASGYINGWNISGSYFIIDGVTYYFNGSVWCRRTYYNYTRSFKNGDTTDSQTERFYCRLTLFFNPGCFLSTIVTRYASTANAPYYSNGEIIYNGKTGVIYDYDQPTETIVRGNITLSDNIISAAGMTGTSSKKAVFFTSNKVYIVNDGASYNAEASKTGVLIIPLSSIQYGVGTDASVYDANLDRDVGGSINLRDNPDVLSIDNILVYGKYYIFSSAGNGLVFYDTSINRASQLKSNAIYRTFATTSENTLISYGFINEDAPYTYTDQPYAKVIISYVK